MIASNSVRKYKPQTTEISHIKTAQKQGYLDLLYIIYNM